MGYRDLLQIKTMRLIIGVPGAGKTTYLAKKLSDLPHDSYIFTSLTNASIRAFLQKIGKREKYNSIRTVYGLAYKKLKEEGMLPEWKQKWLEPANNEKIYRKLFAENNISLIYQEDAKSFLTYLVLDSLENGRDLISTLSDNFNKLLLISNNKKTVSKLYGMFYALIHMYNQKKFYDYPFLIYEAMENGLDFFKVFIGDREKEPELIVFDEFQDVPLILYNYLAKLGKLKNVLLVGDPAQEIFSFLKTDSKFILSRVGKTDYLDKTYRFGKEISDLANRILKMMRFKFRIKEAIRSSKVYYLDYSLSNLKTALYKVLKYYDETIILVRTKEMVYSLEKEIADFNKYATIINLERYDFEKIQYYLKLVEKEKTRRKTILDFLKKEEDLVKEILGQDRYATLITKIVKSSKKIYLATVHSVKGLEFDNVFFIDKIPKKVLSLLDLGEISEIEELKVVYVAITRAKYNLFVFRTDSGYFSLFSI